MCGFGRTPWFPVSGFSQMPGFAGLGGTLTTD
jgi:hypothetical protein